MMESFFCSDCGKQYSSEKKLKKHQRLFHSNELYKCEECGKEVEGAKKIENHKRTNIMKICQYCDIVFPITSLPKEKRRGATWNENCQKNWNSNSSI